MLTLHIPGDDYFDETTGEFFTTKDKIIVIEYSLVSISKWESKHKKSLLNSLKDLTIEEMCDFIRCMTLTQNVDPNIYRAMSQDIIKEVLDYMADPMTATTFSNNQPNTGRKNEIITSELVYYWMSALQIPMECQKWHFNRLMTLIRIASEKNQPPKKMSKSDILKQNKALNAQRRAKYKTRG